MINFSSSSNAKRGIRVPGTSGNLVVKSKLPPRSGSSLEAVEPHP